MCCCYSNPFLYDAAPPAPAHATYILTSKYADFAGIPPPPPLSNPLLPCLLKDDGLSPYPPLQSVMETDSVLFSVSHCLHDLLVSCRSRLVALSGEFPFF